MRRLIASEIQVELQGVMMSLLFLLELSSTAPSLVTKLGKEGKNVKRKTRRNIVVENTSKAGMLREKNEMEKR